MKAEFRENLCSESLFFLLVRIFIWIVFDTFTTNLLESRESKYFAKSLEKGHTKTIGSESAQIFSFLTKLIFLYWNYLSHCE